MVIGEYGSVTFKILKQQNEGFTSATNVPGYVVYTLFPLIKNVAYHY